MMFLNESAHLMYLFKAILVLMVSQKILIIYKRVKNIVDRSVRIPNNCDWCKKVHNDRITAAKRCLDGQLDTFYSFPLLIDILLSK